MLARLASLLGGGPEPDPMRQNKKIQVATCALLLEVAHADQELHELEEKTIRSLLADKFDLDEQASSELISYARGQLEESPDLFRFAREINNHFNIDEKLQVMETIWRIIYADGVLDRYEDALARQLSNLLHIDHPQSIALKLKVLEALR